MSVGTYTMTAHFTQAVDKVTFNDTAKYTVDINPQFRLELQNLTNAFNLSGCMYPGTLAWQTVKIENTGTVNLSNIVLVLNVEDASTASQSHFVIRDTLIFTIPVGDIVEYTFKEQYAVPSNYIYNVKVIGYLACDSAMLYESHVISECADFDDISLVGLVNPPEGEKDVQGQSVNIEINLKNYSEMRTWEDVVITAIISYVKEGIVYTSKLSDNLDIKELKDTVYRFKDSYIVPDEEQYSLTIYIDKQDAYQHNDTLIAMRETIKAPGIGMVNLLAIRLEQNVPNPTNDKTVIRYSVPQDGEVAFKIYSVSGQVLYNEVENVSFGEHELEINISNFAAGVYFYMMEFEGQRITKRMSKQ